jgi:hypothetical protein
VPRATGFAIQIETTAQPYRRGLVVREVPITFRDRRAGSSKMSRGIVLEGLLLPWRLRGASAPGISDVTGGRPAAIALAVHRTSTPTASGTPPEVAA